MADIKKLARVRVTRADSDEVWRLLQKRVVLEVVVLAAKGLAGLRIVNARGMPTYDGAGAWSAVGVGVGGGWVLETGGGL